jgi:hypothetical protein
MSDFDAVLERLLNEPSFASALAADPETTLAGYRLAADEVDLLRSQVSTDPGGGPAAVETRTTRASTFGLFSSFADIGHTLSQPPVADAGALGAWSEFGTAAGIAVQHGAEAAGSHGDAQGVGDAPWGTGGSDAQQGWAPASHSGFGPAPDHEAGTDLDGLPPSSAGLGDAPSSGLGEPGRFSGEAERSALPRDYHPRIDADGDGHRDKATFASTKDGGVEIRVDLDHDGKADFVGHDTDRDRLVDYADYDKDHDGTFEKRMYDDNGDGWLDRSVWHEH